MTLRCAHSAVDVVVPTHNRLWSIRPLVEELISQECIRRIIIVDDGSTDGSGEWLAALAEDRVLLVGNPGRRGAACCRNRGISHAAADLVAFLDDDVFLRPEGALCELATELERSPYDLLAPAQTVLEREAELGVPRCDASLDAAGRVRNFNPLTLELRPGVPLVDGEGGSQLVPAGLCTGVFVVKRHLLRKVRYAEDLGLTSYRDDTDFQLATLEAGFSIGIHRGVLSVDRRRPGSERGGCHAGMTLAQYEWLAIRNNWRILRRHRSTIRSRLRIRTPVALMHAAFIMERVLLRLPRQLGYRAVVGLRGVVTR